MSQPYFHSENRAAFSQYIFDHLIINVELLRDKIRFKNWKLTLKNVKHYLDKHGLLSTIPKIGEVTNTQKTLQRFQNWCYGYD